MFSKKFLQHFQKPKNRGVLKKPTAIGFEGIDSCGDTVKIFLSVRNNRISSIKFQSFGCASALASASAVTELAKGKGLNEAGKISISDVISFLGGLPDNKLHCAELALRALKKAISNLEENQ